MWGLIRNEITKLIKSKKFIIYCFSLLIILVYANSSIYKFANQQKPEVKIRNNNITIISLENQIKIDKSLNNEDIDKAKEQIKQLENENAALQDELDNPNGEWRKKTEEKIKQLEKQLDNDEVKSNSNRVEALNNQISRYKYYLENDIVPVKEYEITSYQTIVKVMNMLNVLLLPVLIAFITSDIISGEQTNRTIKTLLTKPVSRMKIVISKYIAYSVTLILALSLMQLINFLFVGFRFTFGSARDPFIIGTKYVFNDTNILAVQNSSYIWPIEKVIIIAFLMQLLFILSYIAVTLLISVLANTSVVSLIVSFTATSIISLITFFMPVKFLNKIYPFFLTTYSNAPGLLTGDTSKLTFSQAVNAANGTIIMIIYGVACLVLALMIFNKKDILA